MKWEKDWRFIGVLVSSRFSSAWRIGKVGIKVILLIEWSGTWVGTTAKNKRMKMKNTKED